MDRIREMLESVTNESYKDVCSKSIKIISELAYDINYHKDIIDLGYRLVYASGFMDFIDDNIDYEVIDEIAERAFERLLPIYKRMKKINPDIKDYVFTYYKDILGEDRYVDYKTTGVLDIFLTRDNVREMLSLFDPESIILNYSWIFDMDNKLDVNCDDFVFEAVKEAPDTLDEVLADAVTNNLYFPFLNMLDKDYINYLSPRAFEILFGIELSLKMRINDISERLIAYKIELKNLRTNESIFKINYNIGIDNQIKNYIMSDYHRYLRLKAYEEKDYDTLLDNMKYVNDLDNLEAYITNLPEQYADRLLDIYYDYILEHIADVSNDRHYYSKMINHAEMLTKLGNINMLYDLIDEIKKKYRTRKALISELSILEARMQSPFYGIEYITRI